MTSKKLQKFKIEFTVIILICLTAVTASEVFDIFRKKTAGYNEWKEGTDSFTIPPSLCHVGESSSMTCARFNAKTERYNSNPCHCSCSSKNATFMFVKDQWRCTKNSDVRDLLGEYKIHFIMMPFLFPKIVPRLESHLFNFLRYDCRNEIGNDI